MSKHQFVLGLIVNPVAGLGGSVALKGSDGMVEQALALGAVPKANLRAEAALAVLLPYKDQIQIVTVAGDMGESLATNMGFETHIAYRAASEQTSASDTKAALSVMLQKGIDVLMFAGGDGTARDVCSVFEFTASKTPVLGIPAGCKIHSGVYAITPKAAGRVVEMLINGELVTLAENDVMDIDEHLFRQGVVKAKRYGEMLVPSELRYVQAVKMGGKESDELVLQDLSEFVVSEMEEDIRYIMGSGSTVASVMEEMGLPNTLLGVDLVQDQELLAQDLTAKALLAQIEGHECRLVITVIGGQGHIFGRGNQQLSPEVIKAVGHENILIIATKAKLQSLNGRPLQVDTGDSELDESLSGFMQVLVGYNDYVMYPVASMDE